MLNAMLTLKCLFQKPFKEMATPPLRNCTQVIFGLCAITRNTKSWDGYVESEPSTLQQ